MEFCKHNCDTDPFGCKGFCAEAHARAIEQATANAPPWMKMALYGPDEKSTSQADRDALAEYGKNMADSITQVAERSMQELLAKLLDTLTDAQRAKLFALYNHETGERK